MIIMIMDSPARAARAAAAPAAASPRGGRGLRVGPVTPAGALIPAQLERDSG